jgi:hypothetical protein
MMGQWEALRHHSLAHHGLRRSGFRRSLGFACANFPGPAETELFVLHRGRAFNEHAYDDYRELKIRISRGFG